MEEQAAEAQKEKKLRERNEQYSRQLEDELEGLKVTVEDIYTVLRVSTHLENSQSWRNKTNKPVSLLIQVKQAGSSVAPASADQTHELGRLRAEMEKKTLLFEEELSRREAQHSTELKALRKELRDAESQQLTLQKEILMLKDKLDKIRRERYLDNLVTPFVLGLPSQ